MNRGPIRKFQPNYANVYVTTQSHGLSAGARSHYVVANGVRNGLYLRLKILVHTDVLFDIRKGVIDEEVVRYSKYSF